MMDTDNQVKFLNFNGEQETNQEEILRILRTLLNTNASSSGSPLKNNNDTIITPHVVNIAETPIPKPISVQTETLMTGNITCNDFTLNQMKNLNCSEKEPICKMPCEIASPTSPTILATVLNSNGCNQNTACLNSGMNLCAQSQPQIQGWKPALNIVKMKMKESEFNKYMEIQNSLASPGIMNSCSQIEPNMNAILAGNSNCTNILSLPNLVNLQNINRGLINGGFNCNNQNVCNQGLTNNINNNAQNQIVNYNKHSSDIHKKRTEYGEGSNSSYMEHNSFSMINHWKTVYEWKRIQLSQVATGLFALSGSITFLTIISVILFNLSLQQILGTWCYSAHRTDDIAKLSFVFIASLPASYVFVSSGFLAVFISITAIFLYKKAKFQTMTNTCIKVMLFLSLIMCILIIILELFNFLLTIPALGSPSCVPLTMFSLLIVVMTIACVILLFISLALLFRMPKRNMNNEFGSSLHANKKHCCYYSCYYGCCHCCMDDQNDILIVKPSSSMSDHQAYTIQNESKGEMQSVDFGNPPSYFPTQPPLYNNIIANRNF